MDIRDVLKVAYLFHHPLEDPRTIMAPHIALEVLSQLFDGLLTQPVVLGDPIKRI